MKTDDLKQYSRHLNIFQLEAATKAIEYLSSESQKHALIHLPTGVGKTGIMALLSAITKDNILIILPSATLPKQIEGEIEKGFWESIKLENYPTIKTMLFNSKEQVDILKLAKKTVFISTIQFLQEHMKNEYIDEDKKRMNDDFRDKVNKHIKYIFFDEGHREPASIWSNITRVLNIKIILFTATPYRNDKSVFLIKNKYTYSKSLFDAIKNEYIVNADFFPICDSTKKSRLLKGSSDITNVDLLTIIQNDLLNGKVIIRCNSHERIRKITEFLNEKSVRTLGLHSAFDNSEIFAKTGDIAQVKNNQYDVFVHCDMLIEGLNIKEVKTIIFVDTFSNFRSTFQQIGRALRKTNSVSCAKIYVPESTLEEHKKQWDYLLSYSINEDKFKYVDGVFKKLFDKDNITDLQDNILIPRKATIYYSENEDLFDELNNLIKEKIENDSRFDILSDFVKEKTIYVICYQEIKSSPYLMRESFENVNLHLCVLVKIGSDKGTYYFYNNTNRNVFIDENIYNELTKSNLKNFNYLIDENAEIKKAGYEKTFPVVGAGVRSREMQGKNLQNTSSSLEHKLSFCSSVTCKNENREVRYINPVTSRISDIDYATIDEYYLWCQDNVKRMEDDSKDSNRIFNRFAKITNAAENPPNFIYIELDSIYYLNDYEDNYDAFNVDINIDKDKNFIFEIEIEKTNYDFNLIKDNKNNKFKIKFIGKECNLYFYNEVGLEVSFIELIQKANFRLYFLEDQIIYVNGNYYTPNIKTCFNNPEEWDLWNRIKFLNELEPKSKCLDEKTGKDDSLFLKTWSEKSVFGVILKEINANHKEIDFLVCDDMETEIADFIALDSKNEKIIYIHCKYSQNELSASTFQDVCGQAMKNIRYIMESNQDNNKYLKSREKKWAKKWKSSFKKNDKYTSTAEIERCIKGGKSKYIYDQYFKMVNSPKVNYEVWIVHSGLSYEYLKKQLKKENQKEQLPQLIWLLECTKDSLAEVGAELKIFCGP